MSNLIYALNIYYNVSFITKYSSFKFEVFSQLLCQKFRTIQYQFTRRQQEASHGLLTNCIASCPVLMYTSCYFTPIIYPFNHFIVFSFVSSSMRIHDFPNLIFSLPSSLQEATGQCMVSCHWVQLQVSTCFQQFEQPSFLLQHLSLSDLYVLSAPAKQVKVHLSS